MIDGFLVFLYSFLPALVYATVLYAILPFGKINYSKGLFYLFIGFMSVTALRLLWTVFPWWNDIAYTMSNTPRPFFGVAVPATNLVYYQWLYFIQVGFAEEFSKYLIFVLIFLFRRNNKDNSSTDSLIATMFYMGCVSLGFAVIENLGYAARSADPLNLLVWRGFTSVVGHFVFGLTTGYWIARGKIKERTSNLILFILNKYSKLKLVLFTIVGLTCSSIIHGLYNLSLRVFPNPSGLVVAYLILIASVIGVFKMFKHLRKLDKRNEKGS